MNGESRPKTASATLTPDDNTHGGESSQFSALALDYIWTHAINRDRAAGLGVREEDGALVYPYEAPDGSTFERRRPLNGNKTFQPAGIGLTLWWPEGKPDDGIAFIAEGESDALAAVSNLVSANGYAGGAVKVAGIPGTGFPVRQLAKQLSEAGVDEAVLAFDADQAGRSYLEKASTALREVGIRPIPLQLPDGQDLSDCLFEAEDRGAWLAEAITCAEATAPLDTSDQMTQSVEPRTSWAPVDMGRLLDGERLQEPPSMLRRDDGPCLLYEAKVHTAQGEPESCKGWFALHATAEGLNAGQHVLYIDFEDAAETALSRLLALGVSAEAIREHFHYMNPDEPLGEKAWADLNVVLAKQPTLAVLDGVTEALTLHGFDLASNPDLAKWLELLPRRLKREGVAVLQIDHVAKAKDSRGRYALGAQHKLAGIDVAYSLETAEQFGRGLEGRVRVRVEKDRPGYVRQHAIGNRVTEMRLASGEDGSVEVTLEPPERADNFRPTFLMQRVSEAIEEEPGLTKNAVRAAVQGKTEAKEQALRVLISEGYVERREHGQAFRHYSVKPYREGEDEAA